MLCTVNKLFLISKYNEFIFLLHSSGSLRIEAAEETDQVKQMTGIDSK